MNVDIPQICWHDNSARILSLDFYPNSNFMVTASVVSQEDTGIRFWELVEEKPSQQIQINTDSNMAISESDSVRMAASKWRPEYRYDLSSGHTATVNVVRFSPNGQYLASGSDDQMVIIWSLKLLPTEFGKTEEIVQWGHPRQLRGHVGDIMDLCWSKDSNYLVSCSVDSTAILWNIGGGNKFTKIQTFDGHKKLVQGISMDPLMKYIVTMSSDSTIRGYKNRKLKTQLQFFHKFTLKNREEEQEGNQDVEMSNTENDVAMANSEMTEGAQQNVGNKVKKNSHRMFLDDVEYLSFVRRLSWSTDGTFLLTPASVYQDLGMDSKSSYTVYGFLKNDITQPAFMLPGIKSYATCVRFNPYIYRKKNNSTSERPALIDLPYRIVFAVATVEQVLIYSTESVYPMAVVGNIHYAPINDMTWESNRKLVVGSSDGFCSIITFDNHDNPENLVGERLPNAELPEKLRPQFEALDAVNFKKFEAEAKDQKKNQFKSVNFKSKINNQVQQQTPNQDGIEHIRT